MGLNTCYILIDEATEKAMAPHSSTPAWKIPWMEEPVRLQSMGSLRVGHDWGTSLSLFTFLHWRRKWQPTPAFLPGESQGWGSLVAAVYGVTQSRTRLKWLSSSSSRRSKTYSLLILKIHIRVWGSRGRGYMYNYSWLMLYDGNQHNTVKI